MLDNNEEKKYKACTITISKWQSLIIIRYYAWDTFLDKVSLKIVYNVRDDR